MRLRLRRDSFLMVIVISGSTRVIFNNMLLYTYYVYDAKVNFTSKISLEIIGHKKERVI